MDPDSAVSDTRGSPDKKSPSMTEFDERRIEYAADLVAVQSRGRMLLLWSASAVISVAGVLVILFVSFFLWKRDGSSLALSATILAGLALTGELLELSQNFSAHENNRELETWMRRQFAEQPRPVSLPPDMSPFTASVAARSLPERSI
jgi:hypothetical protein